MPRPSPVTMPRACRVSPEDLREAFNLFGTRPQTGAVTPKWTCLRQAECWLAWVAYELVDYVPTIRF